MKTLIVLNASPRKNGNVSKMADKLCKNYEKKGYSTKIIDITSLNFHYCTGCMSCRSKNKCIFNDDADEIGKLITNADIICVASPVWWGNMPGHLKAIFDRNVFRFMGESALGIPKPLLKGKKGILISACTTPFPFNWICGQTSGLKHSVKEIFKSSGIRLIKVINKAGTKTKK